MGKLTKAGRITRKADFESGESDERFRKTTSRRSDGQRGRLGRLDAVVFRR